MVLASDVLTSKNSGENAFVEASDLANTPSVVACVVAETTFCKTALQNSTSNNVTCKPKKSSKSKSAQDDKPVPGLPRSGSGGKVRNGGMQTTPRTTESPSAEESARGLKMKIKRKTGGLNKTDTKHEIVNSSGDSADSTTRDSKKSQMNVTKIKRERIRTKSGTSSSECDPYEFGAKNDDDELPLKRLKLESIDESRATKEVGMNAVTLGTMTEPDLLGPCEPGSSICLNGIVWLETDTGILVINVTWRGRTYVGTLLDATKHDFAPPCPRDYVSPIESRNPPRGRGKRRGGSSLSQSYYRNVRGGTSNKTGRGLYKSSTNLHTSASSSALPSVSSIASSSQPGSPSESDEECRRSRRDSPVEEGDVPVETYPIPCPQPDCCKRFADVTALRFHLNQSHTKYRPNSFSSSSDVQNNNHFHYSHANNRHLKSGFSSGLTRSLSFEGVPRQKSPVKKQRDSFAAQSMDKLPLVNNHTDSEPVTTCNSSPSDACNDCVSSNHSTLPTPDSQEQDGSVFKTPSSLIPVSICSTAPDSLSIHSQSFSKNSQPSLASPSSLPLPPGVNSTSTDASTFSLLATSSTPSIQPPSPATLPQSSGGVVNTVKPSLTPTSSGVRVVTAHTVAVPVDKTPVSIPAPMKKKTEEVNKKIALPRRNQSIAPSLTSPISPAQIHTISQPSFNHVIPAISLPVSQQRPIAPFTSSPSRPSTLIDLSTANGSQVITLTASSKSSVISSVGLNQQPSTNLKPIQPKPSVGSPQTNHPPLLNNHNGPSVLSNSDSSISSDKSIKKSRKRDSGDNNCSLKRPNSSLDLSCNKKNKSLEGRINGVSSHKNNSSVNNEKNSSSGNDSFDNPASPGYSDISNDSPAPVLEKEVDVKGHADRPGTGSDLESGGGTPSTFSGSANYFFSQPPSLVPAVSRPEKSSKDGIDCSPKDKRDETRQVIKENHDNKMNINLANDYRFPVDCSAPKRKDSAPNPPALMKHKDDFKTPISSLSPNSLPITTSSNSKSKDTPPSRPSSTSRLSEPSRQLTPTSLSGRHDPFGISPPPHSSAFNVTLMAAAAAQNPLLGPRPPFFDPYAHFGGPGVGHANHQFNLMATHGFDFPGVSQPPHPGLFSSQPLPSTLASSTQHKIHELAGQAKDAAASQHSQSTASTTSTSSSQASSTRHTGSPGTAQTHTTSSGDRGKSPGDPTASLRHLNGPPGGHLPLPGHSPFQHFPLRFPHQPHPLQGQIPDPYALQQSYNMFPGTHLSLFQHK